VSCIEFKIDTSRLLLVNRRAFLPLTLPLEERDKMEAPLHFVTSLLAAPTAARLARLVLSQSPSATIAILAIFLRLPPASGPIEYPNCSQGTIGVGALCAGATPRSTMRYCVVCGTDSV
jgi:hypothetical protein